MDQQKIQSGYVTTKVFDEIFVQIILELFIFFCVQEVLY
jgi:hypothetical protein